MPDDYTTELSSWEAYPTRDVLLLQGITFPPQ